jgi:hypothetical protein
VYELAVAEIRREDGEQIDGQDGEDILESGNPVVTSTDNFLKILYQLQSNEHDALGGYSFDGDKELIFEIGGRS